MVKYVFLMRHAAYENAPSSNRQSIRLTKEGRKDTKETSATFASVIEKYKDDKEQGISLAAVWYADTNEVKKTSQIVLQNLNSVVRCTPEIIPEMSPKIFKSFKDTGVQIKLAEEIREFIWAMKQQNSILLIGHQPLLGWIAGELTSKFHPGPFRNLISKILPFLGPKGIPISRSEILTNSIEEIKGKIKSKMEIAKLLSAFITTALGFLLGSLIDQQKVNYLGSYIWAFYASTGLFFGSIILYLATMYAYDRLLMPTRFWGEKPPPKNPAKRPTWLVWRPPSSALWILYQNMMRVWRYLFTGATCSVLLGLMFLAYAVFKPCGLSETVWFVGVVIFGLIIFWIYYRRFGPKLGTED
jgi:phosphohistidine phosphatase SixA